MLDGFLISTFKLFVATLNLCVHGLARILHVFDALLAGAELVTQSFEAQNRGETTVKITATNTETARNASKT